MIITKEGEEQQNEKKEQIIQIVLSWRKTLTSFYQTFNPLLSKFYSFIFFFLFFLSFILWVLTLLSKIEQLKNFWILWNQPLSNQLWSFFSSFFSFSSFFFPSNISNNPPTLNTSFSIGWAKPLNWGLRADLFETLSFWDPEFLSSSEILIDFFLLLKNRFGKEEWVWVLVERVVMLHKR